MENESQHTPRATGALPACGQDETGETKIVKLVTPKGFTLARVNVRQTDNEWALRIFRLDRPEYHKGKPVRYVVNFGVFTKEGRRVHLIHRILLVGAKTDAEAKAAFNQLDAHYKAEWALLRRLLATPSSVAAEDLDAAQWKVLSRAFPGTVRLLMKAKDAVSDRVRADLHRQAVAQYKADAFAVSGILFDGVADAATRRRMRAALRRKPKWFDAVDYELALNWMRERYNAMTSAELAEAIHKVTGKRLASEAVKKRRERLGLVTTRHTGPRPRGS